MSDNLDESPLALSEIVDLRLAAVSLATAYFVAIIHSNVVKSQKQLEVYWIEEEEGHDTDSRRFRRLLLTVRMILNT